ncbi:type I restriction enzyme, S subunit [Thiohalomonas denitrificans]|uniref:Type I restriction enzyme, S subunit n=2 Tax=Thiohalomonas denitrificans TaxID=415747 RepID=A0A1G5QUQ9_9GAMM|nr:type I restriction enzyme, S subunit [Thiohalomonas denitrificans]
MPNDVILSRRCNPGETAYVPEGLEIALGQNLVLLRSDGSKLYPPFLRWVVQGSDWWNEVRKFINVGAVFDSLKCSDIPKFEIRLPPLQEQKTISKVLGELDQKFELNRQTNQTLEQIAQAIFKSWFVDFDPVRAKIAAREAFIQQHPEVTEEAISDAAGTEGDTLDHAGSKACELAAMCAISSKTEEQLNELSADALRQLRATAALFPDALVESELGKVPEGWELKTFGDVSRCFDSKRVPLSKKQREAKKPGDIPYYGATSIMDYIDEWLFDDIYLLLGEDGSVLKDDGTPFIQYIWGKTWVNNHAHVLQGDNGVATEQLMLFMQQTNIAPYVTGAVQLKLNQRNMNSVPFISAGKELNETFYELIKPLYEKIRNTTEETQSLEVCRDTLLPKLLSGELLVETGEADLEQAV